MKKVLAILAIGALFVAGSASASTLQISFTGLNLLYDGGTGVIFDGGGSNAARPGNTSQADALASMDFFVDGGQVGHFTSANDIYADIYVPGVFNIPVGGGVRQSTGPFNTFGFDLFIGSTILALNIDAPVEITWNAGHMTVTGSGQTNSIQGQALPFGLTLETPVNFGFDVLVTDYGTVTPNGTFSDNGEYISRFVAFGTGDVSGKVSAIPEPGTLMLLGFGLLGGGAVTARRRRK